MFRQHVLAYAVAWAGLFAVKALWLPGAWFFWLMLAWAAGLLVHYLVMKAHAVDERWANERSADLRLRSYDLKHISQVVDSAVDGEPDTDPAAPRKVLP